MKKEKDYLDKKIPLEERKLLYKDAIKKMMNPIPENLFNTENFEPMATEEEKEVAYRKRVKPSKNIPTFGIKPKEIIVGQMIGMYESKQDIFLFFAHRCNDMQIEIDFLREEINKLKKKGGGLNASR